MAEKRRGGRPRIHRITHCTKCGAELHSGRKGGSATGLCRDCFVARSQRPFIEHNGIRYFRDAQGWRASPCKGHKRLHTVLWEEANGQVPKGVHLFCRDPEHPSLDNIEARSAYSGMADHRSEIQRSAKRTWEGLRDDIQALARQGLTRKEIGQRLGFGTTSVARRAREFGIAERAKSGRKPKYAGEALTTMLAMHAAGATQAEIGARFGITQQSAWKYLKRAGAKLRGRGNWSNLQRKEARP